MNNTVLLTGTIQPNSKMNQTGYNSSSLNPKERRNEYFKTFCFYITVSNFNNIVFCDNSGYDIGNDKLILKNLADKFNKKIEILSYYGDSDTCIRLNYGYGEAEIIDYAFLNSDLLKKSKTWYKITGRYIIGNINKIIWLHDTMNNLFFRNIPEFSAINTAFFKTNNMDYENFLFDIKADIKLKNNKERALKYVYYEKLISSNLNLGLLKSIPLRINTQTTSRRENILKREPFGYEKFLQRIGMFTIRSNFERCLFKFRFPDRTDYIK